MVCLKFYFLGRGYCASCYIINLSPTISLDGGILEKAWTNKDLCYTHLKIFGCEEYVHIPKEHRSKLDENSFK